MAYPEANIDENLQNDMSLEEEESESDMKAEIARVDQEIKMLKKRSLRQQLDDKIKELEMIKKQSESYKQRIRDIPEQDPSVSQSCEIDDMDADDQRMLTIQDVAKGSPQYYDAFMCCNLERREELIFVSNLLKKLESPPHNFKFFVPSRDSLPGSAIYSSETHLIRKRCRKMVIVLSPSYAESKACDFQTKYAQSLAPGARSKKLIPVVMSQVVIPEILRFITICDFINAQSKQWAWERLVSSLQDTVVPVEEAAVDRLKQEGYPIDELILGADGGTNELSKIPSPKSLSKLLLSLPSSNC